MPEELQVVPPEDSENNRKKKQPVAFFLAIALAIICVILLLFIILTFALRIHCSYCDSEDDQRKPNAVEITTEDNLVHFIHVSDINLDLKYNSSISSSDSCRFNAAIIEAAFDAPFGRTGCDTPQLLLNSCLEAMKNVSKGNKLEFVLISGKSRMICYCILTVANII